MAIYDNDGTAFCEIGKVYDNDGTADAQIGKVYDNDGTADSLVYSAEEVVIDTAQEIPLNTWAVKGFNSTSSQYVGSASASGGITLTVDNNYGRYTEQVQRDFSQYSRISFTVSTYSAVNGRGPYDSFFGIITNKSAGVPAQFTSQLNKSKTITKTGSYTLDISSYNSAGYLALQIPGAGKIKITKVVLE